MRSKKFFEIVPQCRKRVQFSSLYIAEHTKTEQVSAAKQNRARKTHQTWSANQNRVLRHPSRQPIRIDY